MALSFTNLLQDGNGAAQTSYTTASVSPTGSRLLLLGVNAGTASGTQPLAPSVSGCGLTWVHIATVDYDTSGTSDRQSCFLFRAMGASPSSGALTIDFASTGEALGRGASWILDQSSADVDTSGTNGSGAIVQSATAAGASTSTTLTVTLAAFGDATNNVAYGSFAKQNATAYTVGSGFTLLGEAATPSNRRAMSEYRLGQDTSVDCSWTTGIRSGGIAVEVKAASTTLGGPITPATETDTAVALTRTKRRSITPATETDAAQPLTRTKVRAITAAVESGVAQVLARTKRRTIDPAAETDTAVPLVVGGGGPGGGPITPATETDTAVPLVRTKRRSITPAMETDEPVALARTKRATVAPATEQDTAVPVGRTKVRSLTAAVETAVAILLGRTKRLTLTPATETDTAVPLVSQGGVAPRNITVAGCILPATRAGDILEPTVAGEILEPTRGGTILEPTRAGNLLGPTRTGRLIQ